MRFHELLEGASMMSYSKTKDKSQKTWTFQMLGKTTMH